MGVADLNLLLGHVFQIADVREARVVGLTPIALKIRIFKALTLGKLIDLGPLAYPTFSCNHDI